MKSAEHVTDLLALVNEIVGLVNEHELQAAAALVREAKRIHIRISAETRARQIAQINRSIISAKSVCNRLRAAVTNLPSKEHFFAKAQIERVIEEHFNIEMHGLRRRKQELSKPR